MNDSFASAVLSTPAELKERLAAESAGDPILVYRDRDGRQQIVPLPATVHEVTIGRGPECDLQLEWDAKVSRVHAELRRVGGEWLLIDDGSRNGTFLNGSAVDRKRLKSLDQIRVGSTEIVFRVPGRLAVPSTAASEMLMGLELSPAQRRVLVALCRPYEKASSSASPATNRQIAHELSLSIPAVKTHLRTLFVRFGIDDLAQNEKRAQLAKLALTSGTVSPSDLPQ